MPKSFCCSFGRMIESYPETRRLNYSGQDECTKGLLWSAALGSQDICSSLGRRSRALPDIAGQASIPFRVPRMYFRSDGAHLPSRNF